MPKLFGEFFDVLPYVRDSLEIIFSPTAHCVRKRWSINRISAQFIADYFSAFLPIDENETDGDRRIEEAKSSVIYLSNELLENAMKFHFLESNMKVKFAIYILENSSNESSEITITLHTTNSLSIEAQEKFQIFLVNLLACDPEELYVSQVEQTLEQEDTESSGLGYLTMINDYSAKLGWKFETVSVRPQILTVTTMVQIKV
ncbi:hypothetical protein Xen7305DRAFT_00012660 [Xenococcus sp. PCC 7305]|uniref:slr1658 superfamily regulator n=1 Tax=Xenococcus sp. PCC 7305 TaxID=102125 RepID=UPI0002AB9DC5|nr:hypothetical protein [Xenococcus sp. PCC 7305]ELS01562.1 hypothetical protein Xen7305DRAFT_00012660 [Xenococcus sp. PCC 7305]